MDGRRASAVWIIVAAAGGVLAVYGDTLGAGLIWEDYTKLRPAGPSVVAGAFHGSWDPLGIWPAYYRPLSTAYNALAFYLFGVNAPALHVASILGLILAATLVGLVVRRELRSPIWGAVAAALYAAHPFVVLTIGPWFFYHFQLLASLILVAAVMLWQRQPPRRLVDWWPIAALALVGFLVKEDTILLLPGLVAAQAARARILRDTGAPGSGVMIAAIAFVLIAMILRQWLLGQWGGEAMPSTLDALLNIIRGPMRVLGRFRGMFFEVTPSLLAASVFFTATVVIGSVIVWRRRTAGRGLWLLGVLLGLFLNAPFVLLSTNTRYHLLIICAVLGATASLHAIASAAHRMPRAVIAVFVAIGAAAMVMASRDALVALRPCQAGNLFADIEMLEIAPSALPDTTREWLADDKPRACVDGSYADLIHTSAPIVWGEGTPRVVALFPLVIESATVEIRDANGASDTREIQMYADERFVARMTISQEWTRLPIEVERNIWTRLRHAHRLDVMSVGAANGAALEVRITTRSGRTPSGA